MQTLFSKLEDNLIVGVLIKKGKNLLSTKDFEKINTNSVFKHYLKTGLITIAEEIKQEVHVANTTAPDFDSMSYQELKAYVRENNIQAKSNKKADLLEAVKGE